MMKHGIYVTPVMSNASMAFNLQSFVCMMANKLEKNAHKDALALPDIPKLVELLQRELGEFLRQYMEDPNAPNAVLECADIANFAFLIATVLPNNNLVPDVTK